jgi:small subunit ribosomal protein S9
MPIKKAKTTEKKEAKVKKTVLAAKIKETKEVKEVKEVEIIKQKKTAPEKYFYAVGRRKTSVAQVRIYQQEKASENDCLVNNKKSKEYFPGIPLQNILSAPFRATGLSGKFKFSILVRGGGFKGQAEASRLGISRALIKYDETLRKALKDLGLLTRDSRKVERKKPGLKKARKSPQWAKR